MIFVNWDSLFGPETEPNFVQIGDYIETPLWVELNTYLQNAYQVKPMITYSRGSMQRGWNVKYQKGGRALCTLYPMPGFFIALVVVGAKEMHAAELLLPLLGADARSLYGSTPVCMGAKWLMLPVRDREQLADVRRLISLRVPPKAAAKDRDRVEAS